MAYTSTASVDSPGDSQDLLESLQLLAQRLGQPFTAVPGAPGAYRLGPLLCLDSRRCQPQSVTRHPGVKCVWLTVDPGARTTEQALANGAVEFLRLPLDLDAARLRLRRLTAGDSRAGPAAGRGAAATEDHLVHALLEAQRSLIPLRRPAELADGVRVALQALFPTARTAARLLEAAPSGTPTQRREVTWEGAPGCWRAARIPLQVGATQVGLVEVESSAAAFGPRELDLLEVYAAEAAQALHRSRLYEQLSRGKAEWERTFDAVPDAVTIVALDYTILRANRARAQSVGCTPRELVGRTCHEGLWKLSERCPQCPVAGVFESGEPTVSDAEAGPDGRVYDYRAFPLHDEQGRLYAAITYARDVTRERQLTQSVRRSEKLVTVGQIAAGVAHEINNPLTAVSSYAQLLAMQSREPKVLESAQRIQSGIDRIHRLVQNLTSFVKGADDTFYPLDLNQIVREVLTFSRYEITRGDTQLHEQLAADLPRVLGAKDQLEQVVIGLLTNARDAVAGKGTVTIRTRQDGSRVELEVTDDGVGIPDAELDKIFEPFHTTKQVGQGTGLGLFVAAGIAKRHSGELAVSSSIGKGTRALLTLPAFTP